MKRLLIKSSFRPINRGSTLHELKSENGEIGRIKNGRKKVAMAHY